MLHIGMNRRADVFRVITFATFHLKQFSAGIGDGM